MGDGPRARCGRRDDGRRAAFGKQVAQMVRVVGFVRDEVPNRAGALDQLCCDGDVMGIASGQDEDARPAFAVRERVELAGASAARCSERLLEGPPFPPAADRCALICVLSIAASP